MADSEQKPTPDISGTISGMSELGKTFHIVRSKAIDEYASYEKSLFYLFAHLLGVQFDYAGVPFFRLNNAPTRLIILEKLLRKRHGDKYITFWNSLAKILRPFDDERNRVVHWSVHVQLNVGRGSEVIGIWLAPPDFWDRMSDPTATLTLDGLGEFIAKCDFFSRLISVFFVVLRGDTNIPAAWPGIFQQPLIYPPPDTHPLSLNYKAPETPPQSSPA